MHDFFQRITGSWFPRGILAQVEQVAEKLSNEGLTEAATETGKAAALAVQSVAATASSKVGLDLPTIVLASVVLGVLAGASLVARHLTRQSNPSINPALVQRFVQRLWAWWLMFAILISGMFLHRFGTIVLFGLVSFWAFREFITMTPTRRGDPRAVFWSLVVFTPLQYVLIGFAQSGL